MGVAAAARSLGDLYYFNTPIEDSEIENVKNALRYYERAFYLGDVQIAKKIGFIYLNNEELKDVPKAIEWYEKGLSLGEYSLNFDLAYVYLNDRFVPHDYEKGLAYLADGVKHNDPESLYMQARIYEEGWYGIEPDEKKYVHYLKKAANLCQDDALLDLGYYYYKKGKYDDALDCFAQCDLDYVGVYWCMATIYETKKADYKNALFYYQMAMEMDFPDAIERMAEAYLGDELGLEKDEKTALKLFKRAAKLGNGVKEDKKEAVKCFKTAAEKCNSGVAYHNLGICYENGLGVRKDYKKAIEMYGKAVEHGEAAGLKAIQNLYLKMGK